MSKIKLDFDEKAQVLIDHSKRSDYSAMQALLLAANYLDVEHAGTVTIPNNLALWLGRAIKNAMTAPRSQWSKALTDELGLTASKPRPAVDWYELGQFIDEKIDTEGMSKNKAYQCAEEKFRISNNTVKKYFKIYQQIFEDLFEMNRKNNEEERSK